MRYAYFRDHGMFVGSGVKINLGPPTNLSHTRHVDANTKMSVGCRTLQTNRAERRRSRQEPSIGRRGVVPAQAWITLVVGVVGFAGVIAGIVQRTYADRRAEWWRRATWAVDHSLSDNLDAQIVGFDALAKLQSSRLASPSDRDLFAGWGAPQVLAEDDGGTERVDTEPEEA